jgi:hypothetical protein
LGWEVGPSGVGRATKNGLRQLPNDDLVLLAEIVKALIAAYNEVRDARG